MNCFKLFSSVLDLIVKNSDFSEEQYNIYKKGLLKGRYFLNETVSEIDANKGSTSSILSQGDRGSQKCNNLDSELKNVSIFERMHSQSINKIKLNETIAVEIPDSLDSLFDSVFYEIRVAKTGILLLFIIVLPFICSLILLFFFVLWSKYSAATFSKYERNKFFSLPYKLKRQSSEILISETPSSDLNHSIIELKRESSESEDEDKSSGSFES